MWLHTSNFCSFSLKSFKFYYFLNCSTNLSDALWKFWKRHPGMLTTIWIKQFQKMSKTRFLWILECIALASALATALASASALASAFAPAFASAFASAFAPASTSTVALASASASRNQWIQRIETIKELQILKNFKETKSFENWRIPNLDRSAQRYSMVLNLNTSFSPNFGLSFNK